MQDECERCSRYGLALLKMAEMDDDFKYGETEIEDTEALKNIHSMGDNLEKYYTDTPNTRLKKYMMSKKEPSTEHSFDCHALSIIAVLCANWLFNDSDHMTTTFLARICYLGNNKKKLGIRYFHLVISELTYASILELKLPTRHLEVISRNAVGLSKNVKKDLLCMLELSPSTVMKEKRVKHRKNRRNNRKRNKDKKDNDDSSK